MPGFRDRLRAFVDTVTAAPVRPEMGGGPRVAGPPRSPNGASSFHLMWDMPPTADAARLVEVSVTVEVLVPPRVPSLYFWALQVDFEADGVSWGGGHTGLQWNQRFPGGMALNWGGYAAQSLGGGVLSGTDPDLRFFPGDPNTMAFDWQAGRPYRLRVFRSPDLPRAWRAEIMDVRAGQATVIRDLQHPDLRARRPQPGSTDLQHGYLRRPMMWAEVFADCDAPSVVARWSEPAAITEEGSTIRPEAMRVNYQSHAAGGCANTTARRDEEGLLQVTNTPREIAQGTRLEI